MRNLLDKLYDSRDVGELIEDAIDEIIELQKENEKLQNELDEANEKLKELT